LTPKTNSNFNRGIQTAFGTVGNGATSKNDNEALSVSFAIDSNGKPIYPATLNGRLNDGKNNLCVCVAAIHSNFKKGMSKEMLRIYSMKIQNETINNYNQGRGYNFANYPQNMAVSFNQNVNSLFSQNSLFTSPPNQNNFGHVNQNYNMGAETRSYQHPILGNQPQGTLFQGNNPIGVNFASLTANPQPNAINMNYQNGYNSYLPNVPQIGVSPLNPQLLPATPPRLDNLNFYIMYPNSDVIENQFHNELMENLDR
jgi:hypothetical protein